MSFDGFGFVGPRPDLAAGAAGPPLLRPVARPVAPSVFAAAPGYRNRVLVPLPRAYEPSFVDDLQKVFRDCLAAFKRLRETGRLLPTGAGLPELFWSRFNDLRLVVAEWQFEGDLQVGLVLLCFSASRCLISVLISVPSSRLRYPSVQAAGAPSSGVVAEALVHPVLPRCWHWACRVDAAVPSGSRHPSGLLLPSRDHSVPVLLGHPVDPLLPAPAGVSGSVGVQPGGLSSRPLPRRLRERGLLGVLWNPQGDSLAATTPLAAHSSPFSASWFRRCPCSL
jgi:hypothetical protein